MAILVQSWKEAEQFCMRVNLPIAIIAIRIPQEPHPMVHPAVGSEILSLKMPNLDSPPAAQFSSQQAEEAWHFFDQVKDHFDILLITCEDGRRCAPAIAIPFMIELGLSVDRFHGNDFYQPDHRVLSLMSRSRAARSDTSKFRNPCCDHV